METVLIVTGKNWYLSMVLRKKTAQNNEIIFKLWVRIWKGSHSVPESAMFCLHWKKKVRSEAE